MNKYCTYCGSEHTSNEVHKLCPNCKQTTWVNPTPVAVLLQPVWNHNNIDVGILIGQRGILPKLGEWGLIGGHVEKTDRSFEHAAVRELEEETGLKVSADDVRLMGSYCNGNQLLVFCRSVRTITVQDLQSFEPNHECTAVDVAWGTRELCFPSHTEYLAKWFAEQ